MADPAVGPQLPLRVDPAAATGRVVIFGSDPLYADEGNTKPGTFDQRIEIYTPPYLYKDARPTLSGGPKEMARGESAVLRLAAGRLHQGGPAHPAERLHPRHRRGPALDRAGHGEDGQTASR
ncbi:hypothetical protein Sgou_44030 [Streptomyces gougerotii]|uniref:Uncharacterized protein n=1 Tax=Streptomyces gougerotii TaxID=53448 RepID=A0ABQ1DB59_9ACTN|nr:hypothetical protein Sgou_44030 [Streptomyces gougerotii]